MIWWGFPFFFFFSENWCGFSVSCAMGLWLWSLQWGLVFKLVVRSQDLVVVWVETGKCVDFNNWLLLFCIYIKCLKCWIQSLLQFLIYWSGDVVLASGSWDYFALANFHLWCFEILSSSVLQFVSSNWRRENMHFDCTDQLDDFLNFLQPTGGLVNSLNYFEHHI